MSDMTGQHSGKVVIKVVGVGGGGCNAVHRMLEENGQSDIETIAINTDAQALARTNAHTRLLIGDKVTGGMGAGGVPEIGFKAASESTSAISAALQGADLIFVTAGMGGGTGTGAAPMVANLARKTGALTVGMVTLPFAFEGSRRAKNSRAGLSGMEKNVDTLIIVSNDRLISYLDLKANLSNAFGAADGILRQGIMGISELIIQPGMINLDFADVRSIMKEGGAALMSIGKASGENRAELAAEQCLSSKLLDITVQGARGVLFNITGGPNMTLHEVNLAAEKIRACAHPDANVIFGAAIDPEMGNEIHITVVATGCEKGGSNEPGTAPGGAFANQLPVRSAPSYSQVNPEPHIPVCQPAVEAPDSVFAPRMIDTDDLDIPAFIRHGFGRSH